MLESFPRLFDTTSGLAIPSGSSLIQIFILWLLNMDYGKTHTCICIYTHMYMYTCVCMYIHIIHIIYTYIIIFPKSIMDESNLSLYSLAFHNKFYIKSCLYPPAKLFKSISRSLNFWSNSAFWYLITFIILKRLVS